MEKTLYLPRIVEKELMVGLEAAGCVLLVGPKWVGKTTTGLKYTKSNLHLSQSSEEGRNQIASIAMLPLEALKGEKPKLIDEWQLVPSLYDAVRDEIDRLNGETGLFILTGSNSIPKIDRKKISHSGAGRIIEVVMRPFSLYESNFSSGSFSLEGLFNEKYPISDSSKLTLEDISSLIVRGGWPALLDKSDEAVYLSIKDYCTKICEDGISSIDGVSRNPKIAQAILRSCSRNISTVTKNETINKDVANLGYNISRQTLANYLEAIKLQYIFDNVPAWSPYLRSKVPTMRGDKIEFVDPSIAAYFLGASKDDLLRDKNTFGFLFESLVIRDLKIYAESIFASVGYYRTRTGTKEIDAIVYGYHGKWAAFEIKLCPSLEELDLAAKKLINIKNDAIDKKPSFLAIITATGVAVRRSDGVFVIPIGCLKN